MKKSPLRFIACLWTFLHLSTSVKVSSLDCQGRACTRQESKSLNWTTTEMEHPGCLLSLGDGLPGDGLRGDGRLSGLTPGAVYHVFLNCSGCCQKVTMKPHAVTNVSVTWVTTSQISLNWSRPEGNYSSFQVRWTDGETVRINLASLPSITLGGLSAGTSYDVAVFTVADDQMTQSQPATVSSYTRPEKPQNLTATSETHQLWVWWNLPGGRADVYRVNISNADLSYSAHVATQVAPAQFSHLHPGRLFQVAVTAVAGSRSTTSDPIPLATVPTAPVSLTIAQRTNASLHLRWEAEPELQSAPNITYQVAYQKAGGPLESAEGANPSALLSQLSSGTPYRLTVWTLGPQNLQSSAANASEYTLPNPVLDLAASPSGTGSIHVSWSKPHGAQAYYKYVVETHDPAGALIDNRTIVDNDTPVDGLEPGTSYHVSVTVSAAPGISSASRHAVTSTVPQAAPDFQVLNFSTTAVQLHWSKSSDHKASYVYQLSAFLGDAAVKNASTQNETYTFSRLIPGTSYGFYLWTLAAEGLKSPSANVSQYTSPEAVTDLALIGTSANLSLSWSAPTGRLDSLTVTLSNDSAPVRERADLQNSTLDVFFSGLKPGVRYCALVTSQSGPLRSQPSEICNATFPNPPGPVGVASQTVSSINFTWAPPEDMDGQEYNFTVNGVWVTSQKWFLLGGLGSGTPNSISVATLGVLGYQSAHVNATNYTRPYPASTLKAENVSVGSVTLTWEQPEAKADFSYLVLVSDGRGPPKVSTYKERGADIWGLASGTNYSVGVSTRAADGTLAAPRMLSVFTRPYEIPQLEAETLNSSAIRLLWAPPPEGKAEYSFRVETSVCVDEARNQTWSGDQVMAVISQLIPGTRCTFCVYVRAGDGVESQARCISQYTMPEAVRAQMSSRGSNSSMLVWWEKAAGKVDRYSVHLNGSSVSRSATAVANDSLLFHHLSAGTAYGAVVMSHSGPFNVSSELLTNATYPNPPGELEILAQTTDSLEVTWTEPPLMDGADFHYRLTAAGSRSADTDAVRHVFHGLRPGTTYNVTVATVGVLDFHSQVIRFIWVTTRPLHVSSLNTSAQEENITVTWSPPDDAEEEGYCYLLTWQKWDAAANGSVLTHQTRHTVEKLLPGSSYQFSVLSVTRDGTPGAPRWISDCTDASSVLTLACEAPDTRDAKLLVSWTPPSGRFERFRIAVNDWESVAEAGACEDGRCGLAVSNLTHFTSYRVTVETLSCGRAAAPVDLGCRTGITDPPIPEGHESLVGVTEIAYNRFSLQINSSLMDDANGPVAKVGVLLAENVDESDTTDLKRHLGNTYQQWIRGNTWLYLATVQERNAAARHGAADPPLTVHVGDGSTWMGYANGELRGNRRYRYAIVLFTRLIVEGQLVKNVSIASVTNFYPVVKLPQDPVVISVAVGATLGIFSVLFLILVGFIVYWKRLSKKENSDIQIHSMRSSPVKVEDYEAYYKKQKADSNCGFAEEFEDLRPVGTNQSKSNALMQENKAKNRYNNVLPYDVSRVKLSIIHGSPYDDYINANYVAGYDSRKEFIAAQGPLAATVKDFWRMIWEKNVHCLVMLTRCNEQGRVKCEQYWQSGSRHWEYIRVSATSEIALDDWTIRDFDIKNVKTAETRSVRQFHFTAWPDHGVPESTELLIGFRHLVREHMDQYSTNSPAVVHCSAGVGRTGTFIAIDRLLFQIERENVVDVYGVVHDLRMHRPLMVQTEDQYVFLNQCAMDIIRSRTGTNVDLIYQNTAALTIYENVEPATAHYKQGYPNT
ncbi:receptor-type tyrosine-protein phosphatase eta-like [Stigmatopora nigra]